MQKLTGQFKRQTCKSDEPVGKQVCEQAEEPVGEPSGRTLCRAAFFDVDGTLIKGDTQEMEARYFIARNRVTPGYACSILFTLAALQLNRMGWLSLSRQNEVYLKTYKGQAAQDLADQAQDLFDQVICSRFLTGVLDILERHRQQRDLIVLVSATTRHLLYPFESVLKPDYIFCTDLEFDTGGSCTGRALDGICAQDKKEAVVRAFAKENSIDLLSSHAYSDHHSDIPFLSCVGYPIAVNPTQKLAGHAKKMGWPVNYFD